MDIQKMHVLIDQKLQQQGIFSRDSFEFDEVDLAIGVGTNNVIERVFSDNPKSTVEEKQLKADITRILKKMVVLQGTVRDEESIVVDLPSDYIHLLQDEGIVYSMSGYEVTELKPGSYYKALKDVKYYGQWINCGQVFQAKEKTDFYSFYSCALAELKLKYVPNRLTASEMLRLVLNSETYKSSKESPVSEILGQQLVAYHDETFDLFGIRVTYIRKARDVSYNNNIDPELPDNVCYLIVAETAAYLARVNEQNPNKINSITSDIIQ